VLLLPDDALFLEFDQNMKAYYFGNRTTCLPTRTVQYLGGVHTSRIQRGSQSKPLR